MKQIPIEHGKYYHIYNRGNNAQDLFFENDNYEHFIRLMDKYIDPVTEIYAWCLMKNHFHLLIYTKESEEIDQRKLNYSTIQQPNVLSISKQFSNLFNAYTLSINKRYGRTGSLFEKNFKRKWVSNEKYFQNLIFYIHYNPVYHSFVKHPLEYPWSSYVGGEVGSSIKNKKAFLRFFRSEKECNDYHNNDRDLSDINHLVFDE
jgi:putative transposase